MTNQNSPLAECDRPRALIITAPGINCDGELGLAFMEAGAAPTSVLLSDLIKRPTIVDDFALIGLPGGFSYGDDGGAGRVVAQLIRKGLYGALSAAIERGVPMIAPCNGFQIAVQAGLLPGPGSGENWPDVPARPTVALAPNEAGRFRDDWTGIEIPSESRCIWTAGIEGIDPEVMVLPSAHGEGRFVTSAEVLADLERSGRIALRYTVQDHFNGSRDRVAGICDASGLIFGLMPHPERYTRWSQHPTWTRLDPSVRSGDTVGLMMFKNAVRQALAAVG